MTSVTTTYEDPFLTAHNRRVLWYRAGITVALALIVLGTVKLIAWLAAFSTGWALVIAVLIAVVVAAIIALGCLAVFALAKPGSLEEEYEYQSR